MLHAVEIRPNIHWVGGIDWNERNFHGYTTERGSTYNAYLIVDEKIALIDTCKAEFAGEMLDRIAAIIDPARIDYIVANHGELDHSGALAAVMAAAPNAQVVSGAPKGPAILSAYHGQGIPFLEVKTGDTLDLGSRSLTFFQTPMVHWPDNMVEYMPEEKILFSNDAFGQHFASSLRYDDEAGLPTVLAAAKKYYANIVMPYGKQVSRALDALSGLDISMIAPSHGFIWRSFVPDILDAYRSWCGNETERKAVVVYDSMWHSTEAMAREICETFAECGVSARLLDLKCNHISDIMTEVLTCRYVAVGSPTLNGTMMPTVASFLCYLGGLAPKERIGVAFGSYGWVPAGPDQVGDALKKAGFAMPTAPLTRQWSNDCESLENVHKAIEDLVSSTEGK